MTVFPTAVVLGLALITVVPQLAAQPQAAVKNQQPQIEDLGNQRYRIGAIEVDKSSASFKVAARVLRDEPPIEFLVATRGGYKSYESVLEADATAFEFNLACILIGLDAERATSMEEIWNGAELAGDPIAVTVSWEGDGKTISVPGSRLMLHGEQPQPVARDEWIYIGGELMPDGNYMPDITGTLLGVVRRGESVIEHQRGIGLGDYGSVLVNNALLPGVGGEVLLTIESLVARPSPNAPAKP